LIGGGDLPQFRAMDKQALMDGLVMYLCFIPIVTFHEFAHAWVAWKLGDDTAYRQGRVTLNPQMHIDPIGTVLVPALAILMMASSPGMGGLLIGWGRSVPVNVSNLKNRARDDSLISLAGPAMNLVLALLCLILLRIFMAADMEPMAKTMWQIANLSIFLCWFNMLPIPPLDGSHVAKHLIGMKDETYMKIAQYGIIILIVSLQIPAVQGFLYAMTGGTIKMMAAVTGL
jgi:Zn-dependent protease